MNPSVIVVVVVVLLLSGHQKRKKEGMENLTNNTIKRLTRRGGVTRISGLVYEPVRDNMEAYLKILSYYCVVYMDSQKKKTVRVSHVIQDLKKMGGIHYRQDL